MTRITHLDIRSSFRLVTLLVCLLLAVPGVVAGQQAPETASADAEPDRVAQNTKKKKKKRKIKKRARKKTKKKRRGKKGKKAKKAPSEKAPKVQEDPFAPETEGAAANPAPSEPDPVPKSDPTAGSPPAAATEPAGPAAPSPASDGSPSSPDKPTSSPTALQPFSKDSASPSADSSDSGASSTEEEELTDFEAEEAESDQESARMMGHGGGAGGPGGPSKKGFKIFADLLLEYQVGQEKFEFTPHHTHVIIQAMVTDSILFAMEMSDEPEFFELVWNVTPYLSLRAGRLLIPFGTNEFHHLIGGRVDELSNFLPEVWADYGIGLHHMAYDGDYFALEYDLYAVNGFQGLDAPIIGTGTLTDNNANKGVGGRLKMIFLGDYHLTGSVYYDVWDEKDTYNLVYYSVGLELSQGFIPVPVLNRIGIRGEWARGEFRTPSGDHQQGILPHTYARAGFYGELKARILEELAFRFRTGFINPDNTVTDDGDLWVFEPALIIGSGALTVVVAYQMTMLADQSYDPELPADMLYAKFFLQY